MPHRNLYCQDMAVMETLEPRLLLSGSAEHWQTQFIDPLAGDVYTQAVDFNNVGQALVLSGSAMGELHPFIWQNSVSSEITSLIPGSQDPGFLPEVVGINNAGLVLGNRAADGVFPEAMGYILDPASGQIVYIEPLAGDARTYAIDLANNGTVLAISEDSMLTKHVMLWQQGAVQDITAMIPLDDWGDPSPVVAVNDLGQVLGQRSIWDEWWWEQTWRAFVLDTSTGAMVDLEPVGDDNNTYARLEDDTGTNLALAGDIDDLGRVVGISSYEDYWGASQYEHVCVWEDGFPTEITFYLPGYDPDDPLFMQNPPRVAAINSSGQILGTSDHDTALLADDIAYIMTPVETSGADVSIEKFQMLNFDGSLEYGYRVYAADVSLAGLQTTTPWGESIDVDAWLPQDWAGEHITQQDGILSFEADTDQFDHRWFALVWAGLTSPQWTAVETGQADLTVFTMDAQWTGAVDLSALDAPVSPPYLVFPGPDENGVPLSPTFQWDQWADAPETGFAYLDLSRSSDGQNAYSLSLPADAAEWTAPGSLARNTTYDLSLGFVDTDAVIVNDMSVSISASAVCYQHFTTANGTVSQVYIERSESDTGSGAELGYSIEAAGTDLLRLQTITPWGELFTSNDLLPAGWDGEDFSADLGGLYFTAFTATDGQQRLAVRWSQLSQEQWESLDEDVSLVSVIFDGGLWQAGRGFDDLMMPDQIPTLLGPSDGQTGVGLLPTLEWTEWETAGFGNVIRLWVSTPDHLWPASQSTLPSYATSWQPQQPLNAGTTYEAGVEFVQSNWDLDQETEVTTESVTRRVVQFTTLPTGVSQVDVRRTIDYGAARTSLDDAYEYRISVAGLGLSQISVTSPWDVTADTADLLDATGGTLAPGEARVGPLHLDVRQVEGVTYVSFLWRCLSDDQWAMLETGSAGIEVIHEGGSWSASGIGLAEVAQHLREPGPTQPIQDGTVELEGLIGWQAWSGAPAGGYVAVEALQFFDGTMWPVADSELPAGASFWALPPMAAGVVGMELAFVNETSSALSGAQLTRSSGTRSTVLLTTSLPAESTRVNPDTGHVYVLTPEDCSWEQARDYARLMGGDLVTLNDAEEETWLGEQYCEEGSFESYWIGLNDLDEGGTWVWSSGQAVTYTAPNWSAWEGATISYIDYSNWGTLNSAWYAAYPYEWWQMRGILEFPAGWTPMPFDDHGNDHLNATVLVAGDKLDAALGYSGDVDWFALDAVQGQSYEIVVGPPAESGEGPILASSTLRMYNSDGMQIIAWSANDGIDGELLWVAPADGTFYIAVDAGEIEGFGEYSLGIAEVGSIADDSEGDFGDNAVSISCGDGLAVVVSQPPACLTWKDDAVLRLLDISNGLSPVEIGRYAMSAPSGGAIAVGDGAVFVADGRELIGLSAGSPGDPTETSLVQLDQAETHALALDGNLLYVGTASTIDETAAGLEVYDVSSPTSPVLLGRTGALPAPNTSADFSPVKVVVRDELACVLYADGRTVDIFDVSDPSQPHPIGRFELASSNWGRLTDIAMAGQTLWATVDNSLMAIGLSDPSGPAAAGMIELPGRGGQIQIAGGSCYVGIIGIGVVVVDISDPADPQLMSNKTVPAATGNLAVGDTDCLYVPTTEGHMAIFTVDPAAPTVTTVMINDNGQRRNEATAITFVLDMNVAVSYEALRLFNDIAQQELPVPGGMAFSYDPASYSVRWDVSAMALTVGRYSAVLSADDVTAEKGTRLDGNKDSLGGDDYSFQFVVTLQGDADSNGVVDAADFIAFKRGMGTTVGATWQKGDFDNNDGVDYADLLLLMGSVGQSVDDVGGALPSMDTRAPGGGASGAAEETAGQYKAAIPAPDTVESTSPTDVLLMAQKLEMTNASIAASVISRSGAQRIPAAMASVRADDDHDMPAPNARLIPHTPPAGAGLLCSVTCKPLALADEGLLNMIRAGGFASRQEFEGSEFVSPLLSPNAAVGDPATTWAGLLGRHSAEKFPGLRARGRMVPKLDHSLRAMFAGQILGATDGLHDR